MYSELTGIIPEIQTVVRKAADFIRNEAQSFNPQNLRFKSFNNFSSYVDQTSEEILVEGLSRILPGAGFITEENTAGSSANSLNWIIDPLDGTTNFLHGYPATAVTLALKENNEILLGVTCLLQEDAIYHAVKGNGAWCSDQRLSVSGTKDLEKSLLIPGFPYNLAGKDEEYFQLIRQLLSRCHGIRSSGASAVDLVHVATGCADAYFEFNLYLWDIAAGILLVQEAGGTVSDFYGGNRHLEAFEIVAAGKVYPALLRELKTLWKR
ncbi:MAG: inositol monophosphatase [Bacteroidales bacterium]|nr:inositol monophosphatase [Bacteroidales bacterium]